MSDPSFETDTLRSMRQPGPIAGDNDTTGTQYGSET
jgi:hypothetical protein